MKNEAEKPGLHGLSDRCLEAFRRHYGADPTVAAHAPGRFEAMGNHTDYNEGLVLSAAIDVGTVFAARPSDSGTCTVVTGNMDRAASFEADMPAPNDAEPWSNYVAGVHAKLTADAPQETGFDALFLSDVPMAAGLSSSAALEVSCAMALAELYGIEKEPLDLAKIAQAAEHDYAGVRCGLLDQITAIYGRHGSLVLTDFRSLEVRDVPFPSQGCFLVCNTRVKHTLVDSEYNERREKCEQAAAFFNDNLTHAVTALRDVAESELNGLSDRMDPVTARRAAHVIGENNRVLAAVELLSRSDLPAFGKLMYESHRSSQRNFENSCKELDFLVESARSRPGVFGARLTGGGFGGSALVLVAVEERDTVAKAVASAYETQYGSPCDVLAVTPSSGARLL